MSTNKTAVVPPCPPPSLDRFPEAQREIIGPFLYYMVEAGYDKLKVHELGQGLIPVLAETCSDDSTLHSLGEEINLWVRWRRREGLMLAWLYETLTRAKNSLYHIMASKIMSVAQANFNDDFAFFNLEVGLNDLDRLGPGPAADALAPVRHDIEVQSSLFHGFYERWCHQFNYSECNPLSEHLYSCRTEADLRRAFPEIGYPLSGHQNELQSIINQCQAPELVYYAIVARRFMGSIHQGMGRLDLACAQFRLGLEEAEKAGLDTEIGHFLRLYGYALRKFGKVREAEEQLVKAFNYERAAYPYSLYWMALSGRELGDLRFGMLASGVPETKGRTQEELSAEALSAYHKGRSSLDSHLAISTILPIGRAVTQQIFRSYADNAIQLAGLAGDVSGFLAELEANGPREATETVSEVFAAREMSPGLAPAFQSALAHLTRHLSTVAENFEDYQLSRMEDYQNRYRYLQGRAPLTARIAERLDSDAIADKIMKLDLPGVVFLVSTVGQNIGGLAVVDMDRKRIEYYQGLFNEDNLASLTLDFQKALADADNLTYVEEAVRCAIDSFLDGCEIVLRPVLERLAPTLPGRHLKIFPRLELNALPFLALTVDGKRLLEHGCTVTYGQTLSLFHELHTMAPLLGPEIGPSNPTGVDQVSPEPMSVVVFDDRPNEGAPLYEAVLTSLNRACQGRALVMRNPKWPDFTSAMQGRPIKDLLFACHGQFSREDPFESCLLLGGPQRITFQQLLSDLSLKGTRSVIMGACESGLARTELSSEYIGLPLVFHAAGVRYVIGSLWKVNQLATVILFSKYFEVLGAEGSSVPLALNTAQRDLMAMTREGGGTWADSHLPELASQIKEYLETREERPFAHPYFWSGFYVSGDV